MIRQGLVNTTYQTLFALDLLPNRRSRQQQQITEDQRREIAKQPLFFDEA